MQIILLIAFLVPAVLFLLTQQNTLRLIRPENRSLKPGLVWLQLIPLFVLVWQFIVLKAIADSLQKEFLSNDDNSILGVADVADADLSGKKPTLIPGMLYASVYCLLVVLIFWIDLRYRGEEASLSTVVVGVLAIVTFVCWIVYWVILAGYQRRLKRGDWPFDRS